MQIIVAENVGKLGIHPSLVRHFGIVGSAFVNDFQRHTIGDGLAHGVFVDVVAEDPLRFIDGRAGVADASRQWDALVQIRRQS